MSRRRLTRYVSLGQRPSNLLIAFRANRGNRLSSGVIRLGCDYFFALGALDKNGQVLHEKIAPSKKASVWRFERIKPAVYEVDCETSIGSTTVLLNSAS